MLTSNISQYFSNDWRQEYNKFLKEEHWSNFIKEFNQLLNSSSEPEQLPYFNEEITPHIIPTVQDLSIQVDKHILQGMSKHQAWAKALEECPFKNLLLILGQRLTPASVQDQLGIPPLKQELLRSSFQSFNEHISVATRAWEKHIGRSIDNFWGEIKGNPKQREQYVLDLVSSMIDDKTWWNIFYHYKHELVYEIRVASGHGIRWSADGSSFIGFLEPFLNEDI
ncbi:MAG: hypothetical protein GY827_10705 [Cytophagales bacterium]|nr:hypothetical protein [Cytophagales bacterium]